MSNMMQPPHQASPNHSSPPLPPPPPSLNLSDPSAPPPLTQSLPPLLSLAEQEEVYANLPPTPVGGPLPGHLDGLRIGRHRQRAVWQDPFWHPYPESLDHRWLEQYTDGDGNTTNTDRFLMELEPGWPKENVKHWGGPRPKIPRTFLKLGINPLSNEVVEQIAENADSKEDFIDYNVIMNKPIYGNCRCMLTFVSGRLCADYLKKDKDGPDGKTAEDGHWAWYINIAPGGKVCPVAKQRFINEGGLGPYNQPCRNILKKIPTAEWALKQHPDDCKGALAGRIATDDFRENEKCPRCAGQKVSTDNELLEDQYYKMRDVPDRFQKLPFPEDWEKGLCRQPVQYRPKDGVPKHPVLVPCQLYEEAMLLDGYQVPEEDIFLPEHGMSLVEWREIVAQRDQEAEAREREEVMSVAQRLADEQAYLQRINELTDALILEDLKTRP